MNNRLIALVGTGLLALTSCGNEAATSDSGAPLSGRTFLSTSVTENGKPRPLAPGTKLRLQFTTDGKLSWDAGCNSSQATVSTADGRLSLGKEIISTAMGCLGPLQGQDSWVGGVLSAKPAWTQAGDKLVLTTETTTISLLDEQAAEPDVALDGTKWKLTSVVDGQTASHRPGFDKVWMTLNGERVTGSTGCNSFQGVVARSTGKVTFGELATTRRGCLGDAAAVEALVFKGLKGDLTAAVDGSNLTLRNAAGGLDFTATR